MIALPSFASATSIEVAPAAIQLLGSDGRAQILVGERRSASDVVDLTHDAGTRYESADPAIARVDSNGRVRPTGPGRTLIRVTCAKDMAHATIPVVVTDFEDQRPISFAAEVVPVFSKRGCNAGACHGKASGQNGFRLSLLGFDPRADHESLVLEARGRRVFPAVPAQSLVLRKPTAALPHGGGERFAAGSSDYQTIVRWISQGMPFDDGGRGHAVKRLQVAPSARSVAQRRSQQLQVIAVHEDGTETDVTHLAQYLSNTPDLATVDEQGEIKTLDRVGEANVMVRFGGQVAIARVLIPGPADAPPGAFPASRSLVDRWVFGKLAELRVAPSVACTDAEFARRSSLDICGILPEPDAVAAFEKDASLEKREKWVGRLLERPEYADRFAMIWSAILRNKRSLGTLSQPGTYAFQAWIRQALAENRPYDQVVGDLLTARGDPALNPAVVWYRQYKTLEDQVDDTAQVFLGLRLQCARCHHHPYESWSQGDYFGLAAFFSRVGRKASADPVTPRIFVLSEGKATDATTGLSYAPRLLGQAKAEEIPPGHDPRETLAAWIQRPDNRYFARAVVNRYWKHFFGRGLVEPEDDLRGSNPPSHPELLDALAADFVAHGYDLKHLVKTITTSRAYDRSSLPQASNAADQRNFARYYPRRLPAEVLLDAIGSVTGRPAAFDGVPPGFRAAQLPDEAFRSTFLDVFGRPKRETACECERTSEASLSQSLLLLTSPELQQMLHHDQGRAAQWAVENRDPRESVESLYRVAYARSPTDEEREVCLALLNRRKAESRLREGYEDLIWAVINTKEFLFNH